MLLKKLQMNLQSVKILRNIFAPRAFFQFTNCCLILLLFAFASTNVLAQKQKVDDLTDEQVKAFIQKAQASGMTESQIEKAAIMQGFTPADVAKMRERINKIDGESSKKTIETEISTTRKLSTPKEPKTVTKNNNTAEKSTDGDEMKDSTGAVIKKAKVFGASLFTAGAISFEPDLRIATPRNYQLGPDDELNIDIFGNALDNYKVKVSPEGTVRILNLSPIYVNGLTIESASERIVGRLRQLYQGINMPGSGVSAQITLGNVRSIKITLTGEVVKPGTYTVSSLATVFNALYAAGGPSENGSFRNIKVIRDNKVVRVLDLYDFLLRADQKDNIRLQDQDVIRIADYETRVEVAGEVKRAMIFEVEKTETLKDVLRFAGGFTDRAYTYTIGLRRNTARELKLLNISQEEVGTFIPQRGDKYTIGTILERYENRVKISGSVFRAGEFAIEAGVTTVKELIKKAEGLKEDAFLNRATISRQKENSDPLVIAFDLGKLMKGEIDDIPLKREDIVIIRSIRSLREKQILSIDGEVNKPGKFDYIEGLTVADLIILADGFTDGATNAQIEVSRRVKDDTLGLTPEQNVRIMTFTVDKNLKIATDEASFMLKPFDKIYIRKSPRYENQKAVFIDGQVKFPGVYTIKDKSQRITDLISIAGGLKEDAFPKGAIFKRDSSDLAVDLEVILKDPTVNENLLLFDGDRLYIPQKLETIKLSGEVLNPVTVAFRPNLTTKDYISQAGGFTENALKRRVYVKYANGFSDKTKTFLFFVNYPRIERGAQIIVPAVPDNSSNKLSMGERVAILGAVSSLSLIIINILNSLK